MTQIFIPIENYLFTNSFLDSGHFANSTRFHNIENGDRLKIPNILQFFYLRVNKSGQKIVPYRAIVLCSIMYQNFEVY